MVEEMVVVVVMLVYSFSLVLIIYCTYFEDLKVMKNVIIVVNKSLV